MTAGANFAAADKADPVAFGSGADITRAYPGITLIRADGICDIYDEVVTSPLALTSDIRDPVFYERNVVYAGEHRRRAGK